MYADPGGRPKYSKYRDDNDLKPSEAKAHIIGELNKAITNCLDLEIHSLGDVQSGQGTLYFTKPDQIDPFEFNVLSSGEKEVIDILLDLYLRQDDYNDTVFLIDEPELHINSAIQKKLLIEINKLVGEECQIWVATHSIGFLRALQDDLSDECQIIYFDPAFDFGISPRTLIPIEKTRRNWLKIFETALDDLTGLVSPKRLVYCEGRRNLLVEMNKAWTLSFTITSLVNDTMTHYSFPVVGILSHSSIVKLPSLSCRKFLKISRFWCLLTGISHLENRLMQMTGSYT